MSRLTTIAMQFREDRPGLPAEGAINALLAESGHLTVRLALVKRRDSMYVFCLTLSYFDYRNFARRLRQFDWQDPTRAVLTVEDEMLEGFHTTRMDESQTDDPASPWYCEEG